MKRREFLGLAALPLAQAIDGRPIGRSGGSVVGVDGRVLRDVDLIRDWTGSATASLTFATCMLLCCLALAGLFRLAQARTRKPPRS